MRKPEQGKILNLIVEGIRNAQDVYEDGSSSLLCQGPEYLINVNIFQSLLSLRTLKDSLLLEEKINYIESFGCIGKRYGRDRRDRKPAYGSRSRCDLVVWHTTKDTPRAVIEVKRCAKDCFSDIERLTYLVNKVEDLEFSVAASCLFEKVDNSGNAEDELRENVKTIYQQICQDQDIQDSLKEGNLGLRPEPPLSQMQIETITIPVNDKAESKEYWVWCPVCFLIYRKKDR